MPGRKGRVEWNCSLEGKSHASWRKTQSNKPQWHSKRGREWEVAMLLKGSFSVPDTTNMPHTSASRTTQLFKKSLEMHLKREKHSGNSDNMKQWLSLERSIFGPLAGCYDFHPKPRGLLTKVLDTEMFFVSEMAVVISDKLIRYNIPNTKHTYTNHIFGAINSSVPQVSNYVTLAILLSQTVQAPPATAR